MSFSVKVSAFLGTNLFGEEVILRIRNGSNLLCVAAPRWGKGALCKPLTVQVSKTKKVCVFDYKGEWATQITTLNHKSERPDALRDYYLAENFAFAFYDFDQFGDWIGFGFSEEVADFLFQLVKSSYHQNNLKRFKHLIEKLPEDIDDRDDFNSKFGTDLFGVIHEKSKKKALRHFQRIERFFLKEDDKRQRVNINKIWEEYKHLIIDLSGKKDGFADIHKARAYAGLILRKMSYSFHYTQGFYVFEEASQLLQNPSYSGVENEQVGVSELHRLVVDMVTLHAKHGVNVLLLAQNREQIYRNIEMYIPINLIGRLIPRDLSPQDSELNAQINWRQNSWVREWWLVDTFSKEKVKFVAALPCCQYETNV